MNDTARYFLAIIPPSPIYELVTDIKTHFKEEYGAIAALRSPPHLTLHMPFGWRLDKEEGLIEKVAAFAKTQSGFELELNGFGAFPPRVVFVAPVESDALKALYKSLAKFSRQSLGLFNADYKNRGFEPHMTVAFRDLKKALFPKAWTEFKDKPFQENFPVPSFWLLRHDGQKWQPCHEFLLGD